jgi:hypothetical protein
MNDGVNALHRLRQTRPLREAGLRPFGDAGFGARVAAHHADLMIGGQQLRHEFAP